MRHVSRVAVRFTRLDYTLMFKNFQVEWGKLILIGFLMGGGFLLIIIALLANIADDRFATVIALATACITGPAGYLYGNGRLANRGEQSVPTLGPKMDDDGNHIPPS